MQMCTLHLPDMQATQAGTKHTAALAKGCRVPRAFCLRLHICQWTTQGIPTYRLLAGPHPKPSITRALIAALSQAVSDATAQHSSPTAFSHGGQRLGGASLTRTEDWCRHAQGPRPLNLSSWPSWKHREPILTGLQGESALCTRDLPWLAGQPLSLALGSVLHITNLSAPL